MLSNKTKNITKALIIKYIKGEYKSSILGYLWYLLMPGLMAMAYYFAFNNVAHYTLENFWIYLISGLFSAVFFINTITGGTLCVSNESALINKVAIPRIIIPFSYICSKFILFVISEALVIFLIVITGFGVDVKLLFMLPIIMLLQFCFSLGLSMILSSLNVYVRDIGNFFLSTGILFAWMMPTAYRVEDVDGLLEIMLPYNPMTYFLECYHDILYYGIVPNIDTVMVCSGIAFIFLIMGSIVYLQLEKHFAEKL